MIYSTLTTTSARTVFCATLMLTASWASGADSTPPAVSTFRPQASLATFYSLGWFKALFETQVRFHPDSRIQRHFRFGSYLRAAKNLKIGAFYFLEYGARHDDDWISSGGSWAWASTNDRPESNAVLDINPVGQIGRWIVADFKFRYFYNFYNNQQTLKIRPGFTFFWLRASQPFVNFFFRTELTLPLNYNQVGSVYKHWFYLGGTYYIASFLHAGISFARGETRWRESADYRATGQSYAVTEAENVIDLRLTFEL